VAKRSINSIEQHTKGTPTHKTATKLHLGDLRGEIRDERGGRRQIFDLGHTPGQLLAKKANNDVSFSVTRRKRGKSDIEMKYIQTLESVCRVFSGSCLESSKVSHCKINRPILKSINAPHRRVQRSFARSANLPRSRSL
jgi:hypothetical protein